MGDLTLDQVIAALQGLQADHGGEPVIVTVANWTVPVSDVWFDEGVGCVYIG